MRHEAEIAEAIERQMRERVVDHQMIDILVRDAGFLEGQGPATLKARELSNVSIWLTIGVSTLSPVPRI